MRAQVYALENTILNTLTKNGWSCTDNGAWYFCKKTFNIGNCYHNLRVELIKDGTKDFGIEEVRLFCPQYYNVTKNTLQEFELFIGMAENELFQLEIPFVKDYDFALGHKALRKTLNWLIRRKLGIPKMLKRINKEERV